MKINAHKCKVMQMEQKYPKLFVHNNRL